jgi:hypothetical protein
MAVDTAAERWLARPASRFLVTVYRSNNRHGKNKTAMQHETNARDYLNLACQLIRISHGTPAWH